MLVKSSIKRRNSEAVSAAAAMCEKKKTAADVDRIIRVDQARKQRQAEAMRESQESKETA